MRSSSLRSFDFRHHGDQLPRLALVHVGQGAYGVDVLDMREASDEQLVWICKWLSHDVDAERDCVHLCVGDDLVHLLLVVLVHHVVVELIGLVSWGITISRLHQWNGDGIQRMSRHDVHRIDWSRQLCRNERKKKEMKCTQTATFHSGTFYSANSHRKNSEVNLFLFRCHWLGDSIHFSNFIGSYDQWNICVLGFLVF